MFIVALCPTWRHPELMAASLAMWQAQDYPADKRFLVIVDDGGTFDSQREREAGEPDNWALVSSHERFPSLPAKYDYLLELALHTFAPQADAVAVWEDDDIYFRGYLSAHASALGRERLSKPTQVLTDHRASVPKVLAMISARGCFHSSMAFRRDLIEEVGGWPKTDRADFDLQHIARLSKASGAVADPWDCIPADRSTWPRCQFVYCWHTGAAHAQWAMRHRPEGTEWYKLAEQIYAQVPHIGTLRPQTDGRLENYAEQLRSPCPASAAPQANSAPTRSD
jgi:hypothetical protein